jgi:glycosyltransferase involved in cell wall biosynthesis
VSEPRLAYLVKRFPRLSETFVLNEFLEVRRQGMSVDLYALMDPQEPLVHARAAAVRSEVIYLHDPGRSWKSWRRLFAGAMLQAVARPDGLLKVGWALLSAHRTPASLRHAIEGLWLARSLRQRRITHLHAHFAHSPAAVAHLAHLAGGPPFSFTAHAKDLFTTPRRHVERRARAARFVVTCVGANRAYLEPMLEGGSSDRLHVVHHGTDLARFNPHARTPKPGRIVSVGRLVPKKGYGDVIRALEVLAKRGIPFHWEVFGDGPLLEELRAKIRVAELMSHAELHGSRLQREIVAAYQRAAVFVLAPVVTGDGDRDGIPNVLVEAMACQVPVVSTSVSGIPEIIDDGVDGLLVPPREPAALADAIQRVLEDPGLARSLGMAGRRKVEQQFDIAVNTRTLVQLFGGHLQPVAAPQAVSVG